MKIYELNAEMAKREGFAIFNSQGRHVCIEMPNEPMTLSVKTPDGNKVTFAFVRRPEGDGYQCVDIQHHGKKRNESGIPLQRAIFHGQGPVVAKTHPDDEVPTTLISLLLPHEE